MQPTKFGGRSTHIAAVVGALLGVLVLWLTADPERGRDTDLFFDRWTNKALLGSLLLFLIAIAALIWGYSRKWSARGVLMLISGGGTWVVIELAGLAGIINYSSFFESTKPALGTLATPNTKVSGTTYQDLAVRYRLAREQIPFEFHTDSRGYRNDLDRPEGDVYLLGDSILVAGLLPFRQTVTALLEKSTGKPCINISLIGIGPQQEAEMFLQARLPTQGKTLLHFIFEGNDLLDSKTFHEQKQTPGQRPPSNRKLLSYRLLMMLRGMTQSSPTPAQRNFGVWRDQRFYFLWLKNSFEPLHTEPDRIFASISQLRNAVEKAGGRYAVVFIPAKIRVLGPYCSFPEESSIRRYQDHVNPYREILRDQCQSAGIPLIDTTPSLEEQLKAGVAPWFAMDTHPNAVGHECILKAILASPLFH